MRILSRALIFAQLLLMQVPGRSQNNAALASLPVYQVAGTGTDVSKPMVLYITGDGGWNSFSEGLSKELAANGYPVLALNANKYFWKKKTPAQAAADIALLINEYSRRWNRRKVSMIGYSFGADVLPFVYNRLPQEVTGKIHSLTLLSPSASTDFEIHLMGMMGGGGGGSSVPAEINRMGNVQMLILSGDNEKDFPFEKLTSRKIVRKTLTGGHHYDGNIGNVSATVIQFGL